MMQPLQQGSIKFVLPTANSSAPLLGAVPLQRTVNEALVDRGFVLPPKKTTELPRGDTKLYNEVIDYLKGEEAGFTPSGVQGIAAQMLLSKFADVLWKITALHDKINDGNNAQNQIPTAFARFSGFRSAISNNGAGIRLVSKDLLTLIDKLEVFISSTTLKHVCWASTRAAAVQLSAALLAAYERLKCQAERQRDQISRPEPAIVFTNSIRLDFCKAVPKGDTIDAKYNSLRAALEEAGSFTLVHLDDLMQEVVAAFSSISHARRIYRENIAVEQEVHVFTYATGNSYTLSWAYWVPADTKRDADFHMITRELCDEVKKLVPIYASRAERREFQQIFSAAHLNGKADLHAMRQIFLKVSNDSSAEAISVLDARIQHLLEIGEPDLAMALTKMNGRPDNPDFDAYWEAGCALIDSGLSAAQERRHGCVIFLPFAMSIPDFHSRIVAKLVEDNGVPDEAGLAALGIKLPSESWLSFQVHPQHSSHNSSLRYTGRLPIRWMLQQRCERKPNEDASYCFHIQQYQHAHAVALKNLNLTVVYVGLDDKCKINVGDPGCAISAVARNRGSSLVPNGTMLAALDHDFHVFNVTPSVFAISEVPDTASESFYDMDVIVLVKCSIQQPSKPFRHAAELAQVLRRQFPDEMPCVVIMRSDAGPDRNTRRAAVQLSLLALFLDLDCDYTLVAMNAAGRSYLNEVERCMGPLNMALQNCAFARTSQDDVEGLEHALKSCNSMAHVRALLEERPEWAGDVLNSVQEPINIIKERFSRCTFGRNPITVAPPATR